jgi:hypothetical protein
LKSVLTLVVSILISLVIGEFMLRAAGYAPARFEPGAGAGWNQPDPHFGWRNRPGVHPSDEAGRVPMTFWEIGQRASRAEPAPRPGVPRVDVVGDSITQGYGVADSETYVWQLGRIVPGADFENLGVGGYGTYQSLLKMEARAADPPKLTIYGFYGDHRFRNVAFLTWVRALRDPQGRNVVTPHALMRGDEIVRMPGRSIEPWPFEERSVMVSEMHRIWMRFEFRGRRDHTRPVTERLVAEMADTAAKSRQNFLVLLLADAPDWAVAALAARGIAVADCREPEFERDPALRIGGVGHPTAARHAAWAACLAPHVAAALAQ